MSCQHQPAAGSSSPNNTPSFASNPEVPSSNATSNTTTTRFNTPSEMEKLLLVSNIIHHTSVTPADSQDLEQRFAVPNEVGIPTSWSEKADAAVIVEMSNLRREGWAEEDEPDGMYQKVSDALRSKWGIYRSYSAVRTRWQDVLRDR